MDVTIQPYGAASATTVTISEQNEQDQVVVVYNGPMQASSDSFQAEVRLSLAAKAPLSSGGTGYGIVADRVRLSLVTISTGGLVLPPGGPRAVTSSSNTTTTSSSSSTVRSFGVFEFVKSSTSTLNATSTIANSSETSFDAIGVSLAASIPAASSILATATISSTTYLGGSFSNASFSNIVSASSGSTLISLSNGGLNGAVRSLATSGKNLFVGGEFTSTSSGGITLQRLARYDTSTNSWFALGGGVNGAVTDLTVSGAHLLVAGNFTTLLARNSSTRSVTSGGLAIWDINADDWVQSQGLLIGSVAVAETGAGGQILFAGKVSSVSGLAAQGFAMLSSGSNGQVALSSIPISFASTSSSSSTTNYTRRSIVIDQPQKWLDLTPTWILKAFIKRQISATSLTPVPRLPSDSPSILSTAFWSNSSSSGSPSVTIIGGNFTSSNGAANVAIVDSKTNVVSALSGATIAGVVRSVAVVNDKAFVGGNFALSGSATGNGFGVYDLKNWSWTMSVPALSGELFSSYDEIIDY